MMNREHIHRMVLTGLLTAVVVVTTMAVAIPIPGINQAYVNGGDAAVYVSAFVLGGPAGAIAAALGSALADMLLGSFIYAPATLIIKGAMAITAWLLLKKLKGNMRIFAFLIAGLIMPAGYFLYEWFIVLKSFGGAVAGVPMNLIQYGAGVVLGVLVCKALEFVANRNK